MGYIDPKFDFPKEWELPDPPEFDPDDPETWENDPRHFAWVQAVENHETLDGFLTWRDKNDCV